MRANPFRHFGARAANACGAFTLLELMIVVSVLGILVGLAMPEVRGALRDARGMQCAANLRLIEGAKDAFVADAPGVALTNLSQLAPYLKYGVPSCPAGGTYDNALNLYAACRCSRNVPAGADPSAYPDDSPAGTNAAANGYHDLGSR